MLDKRPIDRRRSEADLLYADDQGAVEVDRRRAQRRKAPRYHVHLWVDVTVDATRAAWVCFAGDLSTHGIFLATPEPLPIGATMTLLLTLPGDPEDVRARARVMNLREAPSEGQLPGVGCAFTLLSPADRERLARYFETLGDPLL